MFKEMRRKDKAMAIDDVKSLLVNSEVGVLGTTSVNGFPYLTPLNYVFYKEKIYFHSAMKGGKIDNIEKDSKVSFCVVSDVKLLREEFDTDYKSVILFGKAHEVLDDEKSDALKAFIDKYSPGFEDKGVEYKTKFEKVTRVFAIDIEHITGKYQETK